MADPRATIGDLDLFGTDVDGVRWFLEPNGLDWGAAASTAQVTQRALADGGWVGKAFRKPKSRTVSGSIIAPNRGLAEQAFDRLVTALSIDPTVLTVAEDSITRYARVQRIDEVLPTWINDHALGWTTGLLSPDPRKFAADLTASTALPSTTGGVTFPLTFPLTFTAVTVTGQVSLTNPGNAAGPVRLRIDGPVTAPVVTHVTSGKALVFAASLTLGVGEFVTVDMESHQVLAQGQASRARWVTQRGWSSFVPGENVWAFAAGMASDAQLTVTATPAWD